ncbi:unnamed protein product [Nyctereutes procyonoides]|uniref:(raccoon dog) hypothetical protein n=1 Tax=Nyctereutes procyonoides TaxID=34880 RepID=A0A811YLV3_NYCPR|nr:unnamed protein product [Nyctereutes procyonoides]
MTRRKTSPQKKESETVLSPTELQNLDYTSMQELKEYVTSKPYLASLCGHVAAVYQIAWSADSRLLVSGSSDSTLKVWDVKAQKLAADLPGHADEVYAVDWSPDGQRVASGGKDKCLRIWRR